MSMIKDMNEVIKTVKEQKYRVRAFDTDYGFDHSWLFTSLQAAEEWRDVLLADYGNECQAYVERIEEVVINGFYRNG